jgi:beta-ketodecanoyl-[acyl-carrier-protein] synthase
MTSHLADLGFTTEQVRRFWLHQANLSMNQFIVRKMLGRDATPEDAPVILDEFANTASAGSIIAFHRHNADFKAGDVGVICSFGAGYSIGSVGVQRIQWPHANVTASFQVLQPGQAHSVSRI